MEKTDANAPEAIGMILEQLSVRIVALEGRLDVLKEEHHQRLLALEGRDKDGWLLEGDGNDW